MSALLWATGSTNGDVARQLVISEKTVAKPFGGSHDGVEADAGYRST